MASLRPPALAVDAGLYHNRARTTQRVVAAENAPAPKVRTVTDVRNWLCDLGYSQYADTFSSNEVNGSILKTLTSEELRDDLAVANLRHRRHILDATRRLIHDDAPPTAQYLPEHGRILDHLSNVRTYHSWIRVGIQFLAFAVVTLRLSPNYRSTALVTAASFYFALVGISALLYAVFRYKRVIDMIESSGPSTHNYSPDRLGVVSMLFVALTAFILALTIIAIRR